MIVLAGPTYGDGTGLGDVITMFPAIAAIAREHGNIYVAIQDAAVRALLPISAEVHLIDDLPAGHWRHHNVIRLDVHEGVRDFDKSMHPTRMFFEQAGLDVPDAPARPTVNVERNAGVPYDYVIAPFTNDQVHRGWPMERWQQLLAELMRHRTKKIAVVGSLPDAAAMFRLCITGSEMFCDAPLPKLAGIFINARCVITVDSMANRLAHAVGARHLLLHGQDATPTAWAFDYDRAGHAIALSLPRMADIDVADVARWAREIHG